MRISVFVRDEPNFTEMELPTVPRVGEVIESDKYGHFVVDTVAWFPDEEEPVPHVMLSAE